MTGRAVWIERHVEFPPLLMNSVLRAGGHRPARRELKAWRQWAEEQGRSLDPIAGPVTAHVVHLRKNTRSLPDVGAIVLAAKGVIDGLVDAKVLPGDGPAVVRSLTFEQPEVVGHHGLRIILRPIEIHAPRTPVGGLSLTGER